MLGIMFVVWSESRTHFVTEFAKYEVDEAYKETLLRFAPILKEDELNSEKHLKFINETLDVFGKLLPNVIAFVSYNCHVNRNLSSDTGVPLLFCSSL